MVRALVPIATGSEEIETVGTVDTLRRAGVEVTVASAAAERTVVMSRGVRIEADALLAELPEDAQFDCIALPGGLPGAEHLRDDARLAAMLRAQRERGALVAAICAAPVVVLQAHGIVTADVEATAHPGFSAQLENQARVEERVVHDAAANVLTSRAPGTAVEFGLAIVRALLGEEKAAEVGGPMLAVM